MISVVKPQRAYWQAAIAGLFCLVMVACSSSEPDVFEFNGSTMGTTWSVRMTELPENLLPQQVADRIQAELDAVDQAMSTYKPESELSRFNRLPVGDTLQVSADLFFVLQQSLDVWRHSQGAFDVTVGPLVNLWGFGPDARANQVPDKQAQRAAWKRIGSDSLVLYPDTFRVEKHKDVYVDLSAIAKGFGVDKVALALESLGIRRYMVEVGGEIRVGDNKAANRPWRLAVEKPGRNLHEVQQVIEAANLAMATSGDYRNYFEEAGVRYSHTIDPRTGKPIQHKLVSVTVIAPTCAQADAWATAMMVLGPEQGLAVAQTLNLAVYMLIKDGSGFTAQHSKTFSTYLSTTKQ